MLRYWEEDGLACLLMWDEDRRLDVFATVPVICKRLKILAGSSVIVVVEEEVEDERCSNATPFPPCRTTDRAGAQDLDATVWVLYRRSKTDDVLADGNRESRARLETAFLVACCCITDEDAVEAV
jgi:hypothetical protein